MTFVTILGYYVTLQNSTVQIKNISDTNFVYVTMYKKSIHFHKLKNNTIAI